MEKSIYLKHYDIIKELVNRLGCDNTDNYLRDKLSDSSKEVAKIRERIHNLMESITLQSNSDERLHLQYELQEYTDILSSLLQSLKTADEMYLCYKSYINCKTCNH
ncbi:hypothetical protein [Wukongibacter sp. M2B1]|uniref:hypothetical protein n=1 Tax=Wukongibacter sp. M2B1 TaxID=3088895 RepID=UPI003D7916E9